MATASDVMAEPGTDATRATIAWLHRRAGWGLSPGELDARTAAGVEATIDRLVDPDGSGVAPARDPWQDVKLTVPDSKPMSPAARRDLRARLRRESDLAVTAWLDHLVNTPRPLEDWMTWFWHGHFVSGLDKVRAPYLLVQQLRTFRSLALAPFPQLVRAATIDPAMLLYLDGSSSTGKQPNENFGRELLELFTLGLGNYTEDDVQAGSRALTGWTLPRGNAAEPQGTSKFVASRHDDAPQHYLSNDGVHDVDTVVAAVTSHPACAGFVTGKLARAILGPSVTPAILEQLTATFASSHLDTRVLVRAILETGALGNREPAAMAPVPWLVSAQRATRGTIPPASRLRFLRAAGQVPMYPSSVAGWPSGNTWFGASTVVARYDLATKLVDTVPAENPALLQARAQHLDGVADALGRPEGFSPATTAALGQVSSEPKAVVALALASPDLAVA